MTYDRTHAGDPFFEFARLHIDELREDAARGREYRRAATDGTSGQGQDAQDDVQNGDEGVQG